MKRKPRFIAVLSAAAYLAAACTSWQPAPTSPRPFIEETHPDRVRVTQRDGEQLILQSPRISGDSIVGTADGITSAGVGLAEVQELAVRQRDWQQTALLTVVGGALVAAAVFACFGFASCDDN